MGRRLQGKNITTDELLKSDSEDENYEDRAERSPKRRRMAMAGGKKNRKKKGGLKSKTKKRTNQYATEDEDEIDLSEDFAHRSSDDEPSQIGPTGRPLRKVTVQKRTTYAEDTEDSIETSEEDSEEEEEEGPEDEVDFEEDDDEHVRPTKSRKTAKPPHDPHRGPAVVRLKLGSKHCATLQERYPKQQAPLPRRVTRSSSAQPTQNQQGGKAPMKTAGKVPAKTRGRGISADPTVGTALGTRRSTRLTQTDEPIAALSNSGKHVILTGLKHPAPSDIPEESTVEESKEEREDVPAIDQKPETSAELSNGTDVPVDFEGEDAQPMQAQLEEEEAIVVDTEQDVPREDTGHEADDDDDDGPTKRTRRAANTSQSPPPAEAPAEPGSAAEEDVTGSRRLEQRTKRGRTQSRKADSDEDEYREEGDAEDSDDSMSSGKVSPTKGNKSQQSEDDERFSDLDRPRSARSQGKRRRVAGSEERHELAAELDDIQPQKRARRSQYARHHSGNDGGAGEAGPQLRARNRTVDYRIARPEIAAVFDDSLLDGGGASTPSRRKGGSALAPAMNLFDTNGPFGGGDAVPVFGRMNAPIDIDSDSSDEEAIRRRNRATGGFGGNVGMTPTGAHAPGLLPAVGQTHNMDTAQAGAPANMGKVTKSGKNALADADPLGISPDVTFDSVGGLDDRIQQLKEMVMLPLMYPEIFKAKKVVPPRGVLFHGPPGTGKTLLARAVASSFTGADGKKVTFYMRKGADCLSKWVGEAERQLRLLFDEARNNQPSIIFFDEIDGLAPVRSSKQEQIHASIVSTLLALMDGMDGRGQVVVIGATNRPDSVDPALRRPGRFDREFYFPLPTTEARRKIIEIHSKGWEPPLEASFIDQLAKLTKGYGGADLRVRYPKPVESHYC
jgi:SpoVK/Ycf46/Vps4 family AAA+-type ATPase